MRPPDPGVDAYVLGPCEPEEGPALAGFAARHALAYNDFASIALSGGALRQTFAARNSAGEILAAVVDDQLAIAVAGEPAPLSAIAVYMGDVSERLAISGRVDEVRTFVSAGRCGPRRERPEWLMAVKAASLSPVGYDDVEIRLATMDDFPILARAREAAIREEHGTDVVASDPAAGGQRIRTALEAAITMNGVALWMVDGAVAFTAQLVARTPMAASFSDLYVDPSLRGSGRATRGLAAFCHWLLGTSEHIMLRVGHDNLPAIGLYEKLGFQRVDEFATCLALATDG